MAARDFFSVMLAVAGVLVLVLEAGASTSAVQCEFEPKSQLLAFPEHVKSDECFLPIRIRITTSNFTNRCGDPQKYIQPMKLGSRNAVLEITNFTVIRRDDMQNVATFSGCINMSTETPLVKLFSPNFTITYVIRYDDCDGLNQCKLRVSVHTDNPPVLSLAAFVAERGAPSEKLQPDQIVSFDCSTLLGRMPKRVTIEAEAKDDDFALDGRYGRLVSFANVSSIAVTFIELMHNGSLTQKEVSSFDLKDALPWSESMQMADGNGRWRLVMEESEVCKSDLLLRPTLLKTFGLLAMVDRSQPAAFTLVAEAQFSVSVRSGTGNYLLDAAANMTVRFNVTQRVEDWSVLNLAEVDAAPSAVTPKAAASSENSNFRLAIVVVGVLFLLGTLAVFALIMLRKRGSLVIAKTAVDDNPDGHNKEVNVRLHGTVGGADADADADVDADADADAEGTYSELQTAGGYRSVPVDERRSKGAPAQAGTSRRGVKDSDDDGYCQIGDAPQRAQSVKVAMSRDAEAADQAKPHAVYSSVRK